VARMGRVHRFVVIWESIGRECGVVGGRVRGPRVAIEVGVRIRKL